VAGIEVRPRGGVRSACNIPLMSIYQVIALVTLIWVALALLLGVTLSVWIRRINRYSPEPTELVTRSRQAA